MNPQMEIAAGKLDVVVATPGRLVDIVLSGTLKLKAIKRIVIDEMDEMLNLGFRPQIQHILDLLPVKEAEPALLGYHYRRSGATDSDTFQRP